MFLNSENLLFIMILGITGSIGSGKTTIAGMLKGYGFEVIDADEVAHDVIKKNSSAYREVIKNFGNEILDGKGNIERKKLRRIVFADSAKLKRLNSIMHPIIFERIHSMAEKAKKRKKNVVIDAPLLIETDVKSLVDKIIVVQTDMEHAIRRNPKFLREDIETIMKFQMSLKEKMRHADFVIDNNDGLDDVKNQVRIILGRLKQKI